LQKIGQLFKRDGGGIHLIEVRLTKEIIETEAQEAVSM